MRMNTQSIIKADAATIVSLAGLKEWKNSPYTFYVEERILTRNSAYEVFLGRLKHEMFYGYLWAEVPIYQFIKPLKIYIY
jgi:hypothetical protein